MRARRGAAAAVHRAATPQVEARGHGRTGRPSGKPRRVYWRSARTSACRRALASARPAPRTGARPAPRPGRSVAAAGSGCGQCSCRGTSGSARISSSSTSAQQVQPAARRQRQHVVLALLVQPLGLGLVGDEAKLARRPSALQSSGCRQRWQVRRTWRRRLQVQPGLRRAAPATARRSPRADQCTPPSASRRRVRRPGACSRRQATRPRPMPALGGAGAAGPAGAGRRARMHRCQFRRRTARHAARGGCDNARTMPGHAPARSSARPRATGASCWRACGCPSRSSRPRSTKPRCAGEAPAALALRLALAKARAVAARHPQAVVIGADQVADLDGEPIGKPGDHDRAVAQLRRLSGRTAVFQTALAVLRADHRLRARAAGAGAGALPRR